MAGEGGVDVGAGGAVVPVGAGGVDCISLAAGAFFTRSQASLGVAGTCGIVGSLARRNGACHADRPITGSGVCCYPTGGRSGDRTSPLDLAHKALARGRNSATSSSSTSPSSCA